MAKAVDNKYTGHSLNLKHIEERVMPIAIVTRYTIAAIAEGHVANNTIKGKIMNPIALEIMIELQSFILELISVH